MTETYCIWMQVPAANGYSRIASGLTKDDAERFADALLFRGRAMPEATEDFEYPVGAPTSL
jgi:hypothetical protein